MMVNYYEKTKDVLVEIDKRATVTEKTVTESQQQMLNTITSIINETVIPKKQDYGEQFAMLFMQTMMKDPESATKILDTMKPFMKGARKEGDGKK